MNCGTRSVIYLITCKECGVQYVGETSQTLRCRFSNHRNRLKQLCGLYLYHHLNSAGHTLEDIGIVPIEEVVQNIMILLAWHVKGVKENKYGLNDNRGLGNVSSKKDKALVVYGLFNKSGRQSRKRKPHRHRKRIASRSVEELKENLVVLLLCWTLIIIFPGQSV